MTKLSITALLASRAHLPMNQHTQVLRGPPLNLGPRPGPSSPPDIPRRRRRRHGLGALQRVARQRSRVVVGLLPMGMMVVVVMVMGGALGRAAQEVVVDAGEGEGEGRGGWFCGGGVKRREGVGLSAWLVGGCFVVEALSFSGAWSRWPLVSSSLSLSQPSE
ncbi:hypothetical protein BDY21DRAFT_149179 [Lineolata rhizophorae]|uniref:Uncharacterized protein n=1 Tax=Lineolata rhizophorae TaxID=578093 RepID=A0A6A6NMU9_9PEZI|nr:hypothetical protein BDY21DRAFT_149179 [Lineolata rhizophorae]